MRCLIFGRGGISGGIREIVQTPRYWVHEIPFFRADVRNLSEVRDWIGEVKPEWVINCAGVDDELHPEDVLYTNLLGTINVARICGEHNIPSIHIASVAGLYGKPNHTAYCASKAGVISVVQSLGFTQPIWAISPGRVDTPMREKHYPNDTPGSRLEPEEIGRVVRTIMAGFYESGTNIIVRKIGLDKIVIQEHHGDGWREKLRVGEPVTI